MENQRKGKNVMKLSVEDQSIEIGWRQENVINSEIGRQLGCGVDV
jgi:hypothetical protein